MKENEKVKVCYRFYSEYYPKTFSEMVKIRTEINRKYNIFLDIEETVYESVDEKWFVINAEKGLMPTQGITQQPRKAIYHTLPTCTHIV